MARIAFLLFTAVALFYSQCARAEPAAISARVSYADLDLRTSQGAQANVGSDFEARSRFEARCHTIHRAVGGLGAPVVSQLFDPPASATRLALDRGR